MKLFSKYNNLCDHDTLTSLTVKMPLQYHAVHSIARLKINDCQFCHYDVTTALPTIEQPSRHHD